MALVLQNRALYTAWQLIRCLELVFTLAAFYVAVRALSEFVLPITSLTIAYYGYFHHKEIFERSFPSAKLLRQADMLAKRGWQPESAAEWPYLLDIFLTIGTGGPLIAVLFAAPDIRSTTHFISDLICYAGVLLGCMALWYLAFVLWYRATKRA